PEIDGCRRATQQSDLNQTSVDGETFDVAIEIVGSDDVENEVDTRAVRVAPDHVDEVAVAIVDRDRRAETATCRAFVIRSGSRVHDRAEHTGELNRGRPDATCTAVNEHPFTGTK